MTTEDRNAAQEDSQKEAALSEVVREPADLPGGTRKDEVVSSLPECLGENEGVPLSLDIVQKDSESEFQPVDPQFVAAERFGGRIVMSVLIGGALIAFPSWGVGLYATSSAPWLWGLWALCLCVGAVLLIALGWLFHAWPEIEHRNLGWRLNDVGLEIKKGVWWQHRISVPRDRVQHTDVEQGPVMRRYGLAKLILHTAGTHAPTIELPGLSMAVAEDLKSQLMDQAHRYHG